MEASDAELEGVDDVLAAAVGEDELDGTGVLVADGATRDDRGGAMARCRSIGPIPLRERSSKPRARHVLPARSHATFGVGGKCSLACNQHNPRNGGSVTLFGRGQ